MKLKILDEVMRGIRINNIKLSQEELADSMGLERTYILKIEHGKKKVTMKILGLIRNGLGIAVSDFFLLYNKKEGIK